MFGRSRIDTLLSIERQRPTVTIPDTSPRLWRDGRSVWAEAADPEGWNSRGAINVSLCGHLRIQPPQDVWCNPRYMGTYLMADDHRIASGSFEHVQREYERLLDFMEPA